MPIDMAARDGDLWIAVGAALAASFATWGILFSVGLLLYGETAAGVAAALAAALGWLAVRACWTRLSFD